MSCILRVNLELRLALRDLTVLINHYRPLEHDRHNVNEIKIYKDCAQLSSFSLLNQITQLLGIPLSVIVSTELIVMGQRLFKAPEAPKRPVDDVKQEVQRRREEVKALFQGQKLLVLGGDGHGKSSLINTFNHVIRLADPNVVYDEVARVGTAHNTTTIRLVKYGKEDSALFHGVENIAPSNFPVFLDTVGLPENEQISVIELVQSLAQGKIKEDTDLQELLKASDINFKDLKSDDGMAAWSILFVGSIHHPAVVKLARNVGEASVKIEKETGGE